MSCWKFQEMAYADRHNQMIMPQQSMRDALVKATEAALRSVEAARFFQTERGFHGRFYCAFQHYLDESRLMADGAILEMEYQKSQRHGTRQRPDIVFHIPAEYSGASVSENNFAVWALKRRASLDDARADFARLEEMFDTLSYSFGFFVNIDSTDPMRQHYTGSHQGCLSAVAARLMNAQISVYWAHPNAQT